MEIKYKFIITFMIISLLLGSTIVNAAHLQTGPESMFAEFVGRHTASSTLAINFYDNVKVIDRDYVLNQNDKVCVGDNLKLESTEISGEWFAKGGPADSPPITWVSKEEFMEILKSEEKVLDMNITLYSFPIWSGMTIQPLGNVYGTVICTSNSKITSSNTVKVMKAGKFDIDISSEPSCVFYTTTRTTKILSLNTNSINISDTNLIASLKLLNISTKYSFEAMETTLEPDLKIKDYSIKGDSIKFLVKNNGDLAATVNGIQSEFPIEILNKTTIEPGKTGEVYGKLKFLSTKQSLSMSDKLEFNLIYRTDELGCLKTKEYGIRTSAIACKSNIDCGSTLNPGVCCDGLCRDSKEGVCRDENGDGIMEWIKYS